MFNQMHSLYEYEKRDWSGIVDLSERHIQPKTNDFEENYYQGIVTPISWDKNDVPTKFSLYMDEGIELLLSPQNEQQCLIEYSNKSVLVKGVLSKSDFFGDYLLFFSKISILNESTSDQIFEVA